MPNEGSKPSAGLKPVEQICMEVVERRCKMKYCAIKLGDGSGDTARSEMKEDFRKSTRFRVGWGDEVRKLDAKMIKAKTALNIVVEKLKNKLEFNDEDISYLENVLTDIQR